MDLPMGVVDPLFAAELALEMKMPVGELGQRMSNWELCVFWPAFFNHRDEMKEEEAKKRGGR